MAKEYQLPFTGKEIEDKLGKVDELDETTAKVTVEEKREASFTNQLPISTDTDGSIYNGVGYKAGLYISEGFVKDSGSQEDKVTGFIPVPIPTNKTEFGQVVIRFKNIATPISFDHFRISFCLQDKSPLGGYSLSVHNSGNISGASLTDQGILPIHPYYDEDENGYVTMLDISGVLAYHNFNSGKPIHYIRISAKGIDENSIITVNQEIIYTEGVKERTLDKTLVIPQLKEVETSLESQFNEFETRMEERIEELESGKINVPSYIVEEAERVAKAVQSVRTSKTLVFSAMSDIHLYADNAAQAHVNSLISAQSGGMGLKEIQKRMNLDFVSLLGDYSYMSSANYNANQVFNDITLVKKTLHTDEGKQVWCVGNHDWCYGDGVDRMLTEDELYGFIGSNSDGVKPYESIERCFGYLDFDNQKIRVIYLNTNDCKDGIDNGTNYSYMEMISPTQLRWIADVALNFSNKIDAAEWGVVLLSHQPVDYGYNWYTRLLELLEAYRESKKVTLNCAEYIKDGATVGHNETFDFTGVTTPAEIICAVHGHIHNCASKKVSSSESVTPWLWRFCVPNMCFGRYNEKWDSKWGEVDADGNRVQWVKEMGTAKETSFNIISIEKCCNRLSVC